MVMERLEAIKRLPENRSNRRQKAINHAKKDLLEANVVDIGQNEITYMEESQESVRWISASQVATMLGMDESWVRRLLRSDKLHGRKVGRDWLVQETNVASFVPGRRGRPRKSI